jgi:hypothetical protein
MQTDTGSICYLSREAALFLYKAGAPVRVDVYVNSWKTWVQLYITEARHFECPSDRYRFYLSRG